MIDDFHCQLINILAQDKDIYRLIYSVLYLCIIIIIGIFFYWDTIYKNAKKYSKCNNISKIIDDNYYNETPYIYNIIIINTKKIKKPSDYIIKITYDFNKMVVDVDYGNIDGEENIFMYRMNDYAGIIKTITDLNQEIARLDTEYKKTNTNSNLLLYNKAVINRSLLMYSKDGKKAFELQNELNNDKDFINSFGYKYFNLEKMTFNTIEDISTRINSNDYKYYAVDKNYNIVHSYTTNELIKFTKGYSDNENYPIAIIDYIIFSKIQQKNNINI